MDELAQVWTCGCPHMVTHGDRVRIGTTAHEVAARRMPAPIPCGSWTAGARVFMAAEPDWSQHSCGAWHRAWGALHVKEQP